MTAPDRHTPRVVVIVGASSGIGRACAHRFAERGDHLVLAARSIGALHAVELECGERGAIEVSVVATDALNADQVDALIDAATTRHGRVDVVVFSAGVMAYGTIEDVPAPVFARVVDVAVHGTANVARAALPVFRAQDAGTLVVVTSLLSSIPLPQMGAYITGKWGQLGLSRILQLETRDLPLVNVCTVSPGAVDTPIYRSAANFAGRVGRPPPPVARAEHIAAAVVRCADRPRKNISVGPTNALITLGYRLVPRIFDALAGPMLRSIALSKEHVEPRDGNVFHPESVARVRGSHRSDGGT